MKQLLVALLGLGLVATGWSATADAHGGRLFSWRPRHQPPRSTRTQSFQRIATFANYRNNASIADETVSEIVAATADGRMLVYTDGVMGAIGFVDITDPAAPLPGGKLDFPDGHEPTSVDVLGNAFALVAVNSSASPTSPSGYLAVVDLATRTTVRAIDLGGQPDSLKISPNGRYAAVAIENERNEDLCVGGTESGLEAVDDDDYVPGTNTTEDLCESGGGELGLLPQTPFGNPAGYLAVISLPSPNPLTWTRADVVLTGLASYAPDDPEPEFVDVNARNQAVVTLQENNHIAIVDLRTRTVVNHFSAGTVDLTGIDVHEDGVIALSDSLSAVPREPDGVTWLSDAYGRARLATANEGDLFGGSRGFTLFRQNGHVSFDSGSGFEELAVRHGLVGRELVPPARLVQAAVRLRG